jgi:hypothetical protein
MSMSFFLLCTFALLIVTSAILPPWLALPGALLVLIAFSAFWTIGSANGLPCFRTAPVRGVD